MTRLKAEIPSAAVHIWEVHDECTCSHGAACAGEAIAEEDSVQGAMVRLRLRDHNVEFMARSNFGRALLDAQRQRCAPEVLDKDALRLSLAQPLLSAGLASDLLLLRERAR